MRILTPGLTFDEVHHIYMLDGVRVPGVTGIIRAAGFGNERALDEAAATRGSAVHFATLLDDEGDLNERSVHSVIAPYLAAWRKFRRETGFSPVVLPEHGLVREMAVASRLFGFATIVDAVGHFRPPSPLVVLEIKSGGLGEVKLQTAGQALALQENGIFVGARHAVQLKADGDYNLTPRFPNDTRDRDDFLACLRVCRRLGRTED